MTRFLLAFLIGLLALAGAACGSDDDDENGGSAATPAATAAAADACAPDQLELISPGTLTVGTDKPAYPPYVIDDDPTNGKGFESALAYAVADKLGMADKVKWTVVPFNSSYAPGPKKFDFDLNQISITPKRAERVDFSTPYYTAPQAVLALKSSDAASAKSLADLAGARIGVQIGSTSLDAVTEVIKPTSQPQVFNDSNDTVRALKTRARRRDRRRPADRVHPDRDRGPQLEDRRPVRRPGGDDWGLVLAKDSKLTPCVNKALEELESSGELQQITDKWMGGQAGAPELQ